MKRYSILTLVVLVAGLGLGRLQAEEDGGVDQRLARLEKSVEEIAERLADVEDFQAGLREGMTRAREKTQLAEETNRLKQLIQCLVAMEGTKFPQLEDGSVDVYAIVRDGIVTKDAFESLAKNRHGGPGASLQDLAKGEYEKFPYQRGGRWCIKATTQAMPVLWEKRADRYGRLVVAFNTGAVKYMQKKELDRILSELQK